MRMTLVVPQPGHDAVLSCKDLELAAAVEWLVWEHAEVRFERQNNRERVHVRVPGYEWVIGSTLASTTMRAREIVEEYRAHSSRVAHNR